MKLKKNLASGNSRAFKQLPGKLRSANLPIGLRDYSFRILQPAPRAVIRAQSFRQKIFRLRALIHYAQALHT